MEESNAVEERAFLVKPPEVNESEAMMLVSEQYNLEVLNVRRLDSYDDINYHVKVKEMVPSLGYVLKIINEQESKEIQFHDAHVQMMLQLRKGGFRCPDVIRNVKGGYHSQGTIKRLVNGEKVSYGPYTVILISFESGTLMKHVHYGHDILFQVGQWLADFHGRLTNFNHPGLNSPSLWRYNQVHRLSRFISAIGDVEREDLVRDVLSSFSKISEQLVTLPSGPLHADMNEVNTLISCNNDGAYYISCLLDFGDAHMGAYVYDIAVSIMHTMVDCETVEANSVGGHVIQGYLSKREVCEKELQVIRVLVGVRFAMIFTLGAFTAQKTPENEEYVLASFDRGWDIFVKFWRTPAEDIILLWKKQLK